jgi:hypothetical protein
MRKALFINPEQEQCGVFQYGLRLFSILQMSQQLSCTYVKCPDAVKLAWLDEFDIVIYNVHPGVRNAIQSAPFPIKAKQVGIYHDGSFDRPFDLWLFSDPTSAGLGNVRAIGRPLPQWNSTPKKERVSENVTIGLSGLIGAWATTMVETVLQQLPNANIRLHLAASDHCDPAGELACQIGGRCKALGNLGQVEVDHDFKTEEALLRWLENNDMNCYIRTPVTSNGISSALDLALAVKRPIAINKHNMFRHIWRTTPQVCVENSSLKDILEMGNTPLIPHQLRNDRHFVRTELEKALESLFSRHQFAA